ncbi:FAD binding domain-containing protein [Vallitalea okinawensis]|uniref:FAD binding domain-containing protein n=1 Tax=Vallitalea okinawensis TaxID=2078660 RepID=UPI000CFE04C5|nr:FAD binding domain-containing protein [Vallitalea okinawensis]
MNIRTYHKVDSIDEAYTLLTANSRATIIAGGAWLKLSPKEVDPAIDLSPLKLDEIIETEDAYEIGCMTTLRQLEKNASLKSHYNGILTRSIGTIMGVPIRNIATIGGTIAGKYGFSDLITPLLVLDTELVFYKKGQISLNTFLSSKDFQKDILLKIIIHKNTGKGYFYSMKKTSNDFPILNIAVSETGNQFKVAVGARPGSAKLAGAAMDYLNRQPKITDEVIREGAHIAAEELTFGSNIRGSQEYRQELCRVLVRRGLEEVGC